MTAEARADAFAVGPREGRSMNADDVVVPFKELRRRA